MSRVTYFDKKTDEMKRHLYKNCEKLITKARKLREEANKLSEVAEEHLANGNELEWEDALRESIEKDGFADGIEFALETLEFM